MQTPNNFDDEILKQCKIGLNIPEESTSFDTILRQKILVVKIFMRNAGVKEDNLNNELAVGILVMGVTDLWNLKAGEIKFSPAFLTLLSQLASG